MSDFQPGGIVDIHLKGVRLGDLETEDGGFEILVEGDGLGEIAIPVPGYLLNAEGVVTHVAPENWPPRRNDVWKDRTGELMIGAVWAKEGPVLRSVSGDEYEAAYALERWSPLVLIYREEQDEPAVEEVGQEDAPVDEIAATLVGHLGGDAWGELEEPALTYWRGQVNALLARYRIAPREDGGTRAE